MNSAIDMPQPDRRFCRSSPSASLLSRRDDEVDTDEHAQPAIGDDVENANDAKLSMVGAKACQGMGPFSIVAH
jgi:hypothetical protein